VSVMAVVCCKDTKMKIPLLAVLCTIRRLRQFEDCVCVWLQVANDD
jgi:hypothetical protein